MSGENAIPTHTPLHPAFTVSNIHNHVSTELTFDDSAYETWKLLFEVHCESYQVDGHLDGTSFSTGDTDSTWKRLDSIVLSWIYATLSPTVRTMVIKKKATAHDIWTKIDSIFNDHKDSWALQLSDEFYHLQKGNLTITQYCERLQSLSRSLIAVGRQITEDELVLQLLRGLPSEYATLAKVLPLQNPLPSFLNVMGLLLMEEKRISENNTTNSLQPATALTVTRNNVTPSTQIEQNSHPNNNPNWRNNNSGGFRGGWRGGRNNWRGNRGRGNGNFRGGYNGNFYKGQNYNYHGNQSGWNHGPVFCFSPSMQPGLLGPGPQPSQQQAASSSNPFGQGLVATTIPSTSPSPQQPHAFYASSPTVQWPHGQAMEPQALVQAFDTMTLQAPPNGTWYMDTGATDHMTQDPGPSNKTGADPM